MPVQSWFWGGVDFWISLLYHFCFSFLKDNLLHVEISCWCYEGYIRQEKALCSYCFPDCFLVFWYFDSSRCISPWVYLSWNLFEFLRCVGNIFHQIWERTFFLPLSLFPLLWDSHYAYVGAHDGVSQISETLLIFFISFSLFLRLDNLSWFIFKFSVSSFRELSLLLATTWNFFHFSHSIFQFQKFSLVLLSNFYLLINILFLVKHHTRTFL